MGGQDDEWQAWVFTALMGGLASLFGLLAWSEAQGLDEPSGEVGLKAAVAIAAGGLTVVTVWRLLTEREALDEDHSGSSGPPIRGWGVAYLMLATAVAEFGGAAALYITRVTDLVGVVAMGAVGVFMLSCAAKSTPASERSDRD